MMTMFILWFPVVRLFKTHPRQCAWIDWIFRVRYKKILFTDC